MEAYKEIRKGNIANVYLFYGEEKYKLRTYKQALRQYVPFVNQMNYSYYEGKDVNLQAVYDSVVTLPFFAEKRLVIVENSGKFAAKKKGEESDDSGNELLEKILEDLPETTCLVFLEDAAAKNKKVYKKIAEAGVVEECTADKPEEIRRWIAKGFKSYHLQIDKNAADLLMERAGTDYTMLLHEIEKIASYASGREFVTAEDIKAISTNNIESRIFDILTFMSTKNTKAVLDRYYDMLANREEPRMIMAMIRRQFRIMLQVEEMAAYGNNDQQIAGITKNPPFVIKKMRTYLRHFSKDDIIAILDEINQTDMKTKNGDLNDQIGVELLLISISR